VTDDLGLQTPRPDAPGQTQAAPPPSLSAVPWRRLLGYLRPHWRAFTGAVFALLVSTAAGLFLPLAVGTLVR